MQLTADRIGRVHEMRGSVGSTMQKGGTAQRICSQEIVAKPLD